MVHSEQTQQQCLRKNQSAGKGRCGRKHTTQMYKKEGATLAVVHQFWQQINSEMTSMQIFSNATILICGQPAKLLPQQRICRCCSTARPKPANRLAYFTPYKVHPLLERTSTSSPILPHCKVQAGGAEIFVGHHRSMPPCTDIFPMGSTWLFLPRQSATTGCSDSGVHFESMP